MHVGIHFLGPATTPHYSVLIQPHEPMIKCHCYALTNLRDQWY